MPNMFENFTRQGTREPPDEILEKIVHQRPATECFQFRTERIEIVDAFESVRELTFHFGDFWIAVIVAAGDDFDVS